jgi:mono/diheme cytochrome c family protein
MLGSCSVKLISPTQSDVDRVSAKYNGYTLKDLNGGKALYEQKCSQCHGLKDPTAKTEDDWEKIVPEMAHKAENKPDVSKINSNEQDLILKYLVTMSTAPKLGK